MSDQAPPPVGPGTGSDSSGQDDSEFASFRLIGQSLGPYRVDSVLGRGGMGVVYLARHQTIGQEVAIKVLRQRLSRDRTSAERLLKEARAVTLVQHTGLVRIYDYQQTPDGTAYIVMERLRGQPLNERIQSTERSATAVPLPVEPTQRIGEQVAAALAAAHAAGIIHCGQLSRRETSKTVPPRDFSVGTVGEPPDSASLSAPISGVRSVTYQMR